MVLPKPFIIANDQQSSGWPWNEEVPAHAYSQHSDWPKISIITPSYNQAQYLEQTIRSVLLQNYPNLEYILIDGASTDQSVEVIKKYGNWLKFWTSEPDAGQSDALNKGFRLATGEILAWINSDDFYEKGAFLKVAEAYKKSDFSFFCGACRMIDEKGKQLQQLFTKKISYPTLIKYWKPHFCPPQPSMFFKKTSLNDLGLFNTDLKYAMDYDMWLKASRKYSFLVADENISYYRVHSNSKTGSSGGMRKFIPEWKMLIRESLEDESVFTKWKYRAAEKIFYFSKTVRALFDANQIRNIARQWAIWKKI